MGVFIYIPKECKLSECSDVIKKTSSNVDFIIPVSQLQALMMMMLMM